MNKKCLKIQEDVSCVKEAYHTLRQHLSEDINYGKHFNVPLNLNSTSRYNALLIQWILQILFQIQTKCCIIHISFLSYRNDVFEFIDRVYFMEERIFRSKNFSKLKKKIHDYKYHKNRQFDILIDFDVNFFQ